jgi:tetratricopeptide (TPR) repeat protein
MKMNALGALLAGSRRGMRQACAAVALGTLIIASQWASVPSAWGQAAEPSSEVTEKIVRQLLGQSITEMSPKYADLEKAVRAFGDNNVEEATKILKDVRSKNPELPPAGVMLANLFALAQNEQLARAALERAVQEDPNDPEAHIIFGDDSFKRGELSKAELSFEKALESAEKYDANPVRQKLLLLRALSGKSAVLEAYNKWTEAVPLLQRITEINTENIQLQHRLARALFKTGTEDNQKAAYSVFQNVYNKNKEQVDRPEVSMARLFQQEDKDANANKLMQAALERDPNTMRTQLAVAQWALETSRIDLAKTCAAAAKKLPGNKTSVALLEGVLARYDDNMAVAKAAFQEAHLAAPSNPVAINQMAIVLVESADEEDRNRAMEYAVLNTRQFGNDANNPSAREAMVTYAWILYKMERVIEAERIILQLVRQSRLAGDSAYFAAVILKERNRGDVAKQVLQPALEKPGVFPLQKKAEALMSQL